MNERVLLYALQTLTGSTLAGQFALRFADRAGIDRVAVLTGASIIAGYGMSLREFLPVAAGLAKGRSQALPEVAAVVSQAASGSASAFDRLHKEHAIATSDLLRCGAVAICAPEAGLLRLSLSCSRDIEANRRALVQLVLGRHGEVA